MNPLENLDASILSVIVQFVDYVLPRLTPAETKVYLYLLRSSYLQSGELQVRVGKRTIAAGYGSGIRGEKTNFDHMSKILKQLETQGCIEIGDTNREGTLYRINLPKDVPFVAEAIAKTAVLENKEEDFFTDPEKRQRVFEKDNWICQYCGEKVNPDNATLDHFVPQVAGGKHNEDNLRTACLVCNSIKSGKTYEEAVPLLLKSIQERRARVNRQV